MIWERKNKEVIEGKTSKRSEEINDIIEQNAYDVWEMGCQSGNFLLCIIA